MEKLLTIFLILILIGAFIVAFIGSIIKGLFELLCAIFAGSGIYGIITVVAIVVFVISIIYIINN